MKTYTIILTLFLASTIALNAQYSKPTRIFGKGQVDLQAAVGLFPTYVADKPESILPPLQVSMRWLVSKQVSLGVFAGYSVSRSKEKLLFDSMRGRWDNQTLFLGIENGFHYTKMDNWDLYSGLTLLYQHLRMETDNPEFKKAMAHSGIREQRGRMSLTAFVGARYALSSHYSVFTELGYSSSILKVGMGYRIH